jgi:hypothetical protein
MPRDRIEIGGQCAAITFRAEVRAAKGMLSRSDQSRSGWIPGAGNDGTHPTGTDAVDPRAYDGDPKGSTHAITTLTDQTQHGASLDAVWRKYNIACPGLTPKIFNEMLRDLGALRGASSGDIPVGALNKRSDHRTSISDRVSALASSLKTQHPEMSHDDCVTRVLQRNKDLADAYERERAA